jgi:DNA-binding NtrC family response regulator
MNTQGMNLFIVDDNKLMVAALRNYLNNRFGKDINISTFHSGECALEKVDKETNMVILDYFLEGENGNDVLMSIKKINPKTEVIMLSSNEDMAIAVESFQKGATDYVIKGEGAWKMVSSSVFKVIIYPVNMMVKEWGVNKYLAMFISTFAVMGTLVYCALRFIR